MQVRRAILPAVVTAAFVAAPAAATASLLHHEHHRVTYEVDNTICGDIHAHSVWSIVENDAIKLAPSGFALKSGVGRGTVTFTATATGKAVSFNWAGGFRDLRALDNGDGTYT